MRIAVIIPESNRKKLFEQTIWTLRKTLIGIDYEIFTKNGMRDGEIKTVNDLANSIDIDYDYLLRSDDDMFYSKGWLEEMLKALDDVRLIGGTLYPVHHVQLSNVIDSLSKNYIVTNITPGNNWLMRKKTWDDFSPIRSGDDKQQEDVDFCQRIQEAGYKNAVLLNNSLVVHCGITNSLGKDRGEFVTRYMMNLIKKVGAYYE